MPRPKQNEMPLDGAGVEPVKDKKLIALGDQFIEIRDEKATLATKLTETEAKIIDRMGELGLKAFRFSDQIVTIKDGARHVRVKTVKVENQSGDEAATESET